MPSTQDFRRRIKSVNNTKQITKAMEMIASIKMQKAVRTIAQARSYIQQAWLILNNLAKNVLTEDHPLINPKDHPNKTAVILITSDRGLCGSYNSEILKKLINFRKQISSECRSLNSEDCQFDIIAIGRVGASFVKRYKLGNLIAEFKGFENDFTIEDIIPISKLSNGEYLKGNYDKVIIIYSHFRSTIKQVPVVQQLLPITNNHIDNQDFWAEPETNDETEYKFEPNAEAVFDAILLQILRTQIYGAVLEANASEHSARMLAMSNATENAKGLIDDLTLSYNSVRQDSITREIAEISGAAESMK